MKQYKPIVMQIEYYTATDVLTESVQDFVQDGKGIGFNIGWIFDEE